MINVMSQWLKELMNDVIKSKPSSKRWFGSLAFVVAIVAGFTEFNEAMYAFLGFSAMTFGMTAFERH